MRKFTLLMMLVLTCVGALATDAVEPNRRVAVYDEVKAAPATNEVDASSIKQATVNRDVGKPCAAGQLSAKARSIFSKRVKSTAAVGSIDDYVGKRYLISHPSGNVLLVNTAATVTKVSDDSVTIAGLVYSDVSVGAHIDMSAGTVTIYPQHVADISQGPVWLYSIDDDNGVYSTTEPVKGVIEGGNIHLETSYAFFIASGAYKGYYLTAGVQTYTDVVTPNGTSTHKVVSYDRYFSTKRRSVTNVDDWIYVRQTGNDKARLEHVYTNSGYVSLDLNLNYDKTITVDPQSLFSLSFFGTFSNYPMTETVTGDTTVKISAMLLDPITTTYTAGDSSRVVFDKWMVSSTAGSISTMYESSSFSTAAAFTFPPKPALNLAGSGTQADPYLIKTPDDLLALAVSVKTDASKRGTQAADLQNDSYYPVYKDVHFALAADIDFTGWTSTYVPIGTSDYRFDGTLDGQGHTIKHFKLQDYAYDYVGLFGVTGPDAVLKNIKFDHARITTPGYNAGVLVGRNWGSIDNIEMANVTLSSTGFNVGPVAGRSMGPVSNVKVEGASVQAYGYVGGAVGFAYNDLSNVSVSGGTVLLLSTQQFAGGVAGFITRPLSSSPLVKASDCSFSGTVYTNQSKQVLLGGIAGEAGHVVVDRCYTAARLLAAGTDQVYLGGLIGAVYNVTASNCYTSGQVVNSYGTDVGGLVGETPKIAGETSGTYLTSTFNDCYSSVIVRTASTDSVAALMGDKHDYVTFNNCYFDQQMADMTNATYGKNTAEMTGAAGLPGFDSSVWTFTQGMYPRIKQADTTDIAVVASAPIILASGDNVDLVRNNFTYPVTGNLVWRAVVDGHYSTAGGYAFVFDNGTAKLNYNQYTDTIEVSRNKAAKLLFVNIAPMPFKGDGSAAAPWEIGTREELEQLSTISNNASLTFEGKYIKVVADIDCQGDTINPIDYADNGKLRFQGNFNGQGHTIDNFVVNKVGFYAEGNTAGKTPGEVNPRDPNSTYYGGLFGNVGANGVVRNVVIGKNAQFKIFSYGGAIAGQSYGLIDSCANYATVVVYFARGGGIAGVLNKGATVSNCYNAGTVLVGNNSAGGIVGYGTSALVYNCENVGQVNAVYINSYQPAGRQYAAGGIIGNNSKTELRSVVNTGTVTSCKQVGGIVGYESGAKTEAAVNYGFVNATADVTAAGQMAGASTTSAYTACYYDSQLQKARAVANADADGVTGLKASQLASGKIDGLGDSYVQAANAYPVLKAASTLEGARLASLSPVYFADGEYASSMMTKATLNNTATVTCGLLNGTAFGIAGTTLSAQVPHSGAAFDTLVVSLGQSKRLIPLCTLNGDIFDGDGTAAVPYLIKTPADMQSLADFVASTGYDYAGSHFKVNNDIDFTGCTFTPVAMSNIFAADFDGNGKTFRHIALDNSGNNTSTTTAIFGTVGAAGWIHNLTVDSCSFKGYNYSAAFVARLYGKASNLTNRSTVSAASNCAAGIVAQAYSGSTISNCHNSGDISSKTMYSGGILALSNAGSAVRIDSCTNDGLIEGVKDLGGIAGSASATFYRCSNTGALIATGNEVGGIVGSALTPSAVSYCNNTGSMMVVQFGGGIAGRAAAHTQAQRLVIDSCYNTGDLTPAQSSNKKAFYLGGIIGDMRAGTTLSRCRNTGNIVTDEGYKTYYSGGIGGDLMASSSAPDTIIDCHNTGNVNGYNSLGGIAGSFDGDTAAVIIACSNTGNITGINPSTGNIGGLVGIGGCCIYDSWNAGNVTASGYQVGGLAGYFSSKHDIFKGDANFGNVVATSDEGTCYGGLIGRGRPWMTDCYNFGEVSGYGNVAGLLGYPGDARADIYVTKLSNSYNAGKWNVNGGDNSGNVMGYNDACYYLEVGTNWYDKQVNATVPYDDTIGAVGLTKRAFTQLTIDDAFEYQTACYPSLKALRDCDYNSFAVAMLLLADGETPDSVYSDFLVGTPSNAVWTCSDNLSIDGNLVTLHNKTVGEQAWATLTVGKLSRTYNLVLRAQNTGVSATQVAAKTVVARSYYDLQGRELKVLPEGVGQVVIERLTYSDGSTTARKRVAAK